MAPANPNLCNLWLISLCSLCALWLKSNQHNPYNPCNLWLNYEPFYAKQTQFSEK